MNCDTICNRAAAQRGTTELQARPFSGGRRGVRQCAVAMLFFALWGAPAAYAAGASQPDTPAEVVTDTLVSSEKSRMLMTMGERRFVITLADNEAARAFASLLPLTLDMEELNGNEKKKELPQALPTSVIRPGRINTGDLLLWGDRTVVVFYQTFNSPYSYTSLGHIDDPAGLEQTVGRGDVRVVFSKN